MLFFSVSVRSFLRRINENVISLMLHYSCYLGIVIFGKPENEVSTGPHEKLGPCNEIVPVQTVFGMVSISFPVISKEYEKLPSFDQ